jgi:hypothetical protein
MENYIILREYIKCILPPLTKMVGPIMNLISGTHHFYERREYAFNVLPEYYIITLIFIKFNPKESSLNPLYNNVKYILVNQKVNVIYLNKTCGLFI